MRLSIRTKLIAAVGIPLVLIYLVVLMIGYRSGKAAALRRVKEHVAEVASLSAARLDGEFRAVAEVACSSAAFLDARPDPSEEELFDLLHSLVQEHPDAYGACIAFEPNAFRAGRARFAPYVCRAGEGLRRMDLNYDYFRWDWYLLPRLLKRPTWTDPYYDEGGGKILMCTYSVPFERNGVFWGVATVDISLDKLRDDVSRMTLEGGHCAILGRNGVFVSYPDKSFTMRWTIFGLAEWHQRPDVAELGREMVSGKSGVRRIPDLLTGEPMWVVFAPIRSCGWSFANLVPENLVLAPVYADLREKVGILLLVGLGFMTAVILVSAFHITRPISRLAQAVEEVANGNLDAQATAIRTRDEIGDLGRAFNGMVSDLKAHVQALARETAAREAVESELRIGRDIQASLLPRTFPPFPDRKEFDLHAVNVPAKHVAGDFFDFYLIAEDRLLLTIADVSGKGVPAAIFMAVTRTLLRNLVRSGLSPAETLTRANDILFEDNDQHMFVTLVLGIYETKTGRLRFANAGHDAPYHLDSSGGALSPLKATGSVLGVIEGMRFGEAEIELSPEDLLVLYTDGVTEAHSPAGELYGSARLDKLLSDHVSDKAERICRAVIEEVEGFQKGDLHDDITVLVLRRNQ